MIKYHDNINGRQYGDDHTLTNNWDANADFNENEYINVHFRLDCLSYDMNMYFKSETDRKDFYDETKNILAKYKIHEGTGGSYEGFPMEHLYIHPQDISGTIQKSKVKKIAEELTKTKTCALRWVDVYEEISPMENSEFLKIITEKEGEIKKDIMELFTTKRKNLLVVMQYGTLSGIVKKYHIPRREAKRPADDNILRNKTLDFLQELIADGKIKEAETKHGLGYRTV